MLTWPVDIMLYKFSPLFASAALRTGPVHWLVPTPTEPIRCTVKVRYRQVDQPARLEPSADGTARIVFEQPQRAVTPGQFAVVYAGERCLGGGVIEEVLPEPAQERRRATAFISVGAVSPI